MTRSVREPVDDSRLMFFVLPRAVLLEVLLGKAHPLCWLVGAERREWRKEEEEEWR